MRSITGPSSWKDSRVRYDRWIEERVGRGGEEERRRRGGGGAHREMEKGSERLRRENKAGTEGECLLNAALRAEAGNRGEEREKIYFLLEPKPLTHTLQSFTPIPPSLCLAPSLSTPSLSLFLSLSVCVVCVCVCVRVVYKNTASC